MKKSTLIIAFLIAASIASAQTVTNLQNKIQQVNEKYLKLCEMLKNAEMHSTDDGLLLKSVAPTQKLDSIVAQNLNIESDAWENDYKDEYYYDSEFKNTLWLENYWNPTVKTWYIPGKTELGYDNMDLVNSVLMYSRESEADPLIQDVKMLLYYNPAGLLDSVITYLTVDGGINWMMDMKQINHYNASKQLEVTDFWIFDEDADAMYFAMKMVYSYNVAGKITTSTTVYLSEGDEVTFSKIKYSYDGTGRKTSMVNTIISFLTFEMENYDSTIYRYNEAGKPSIEIYSIWENEAWLDKDKYESEYNPVGDVAFDIYSTWNGTSWVLDGKDEYLYSDANFSDAIFPDFYMLYGMVDEVELDFNKLVIGMKNYDRINDDWKYTGKLTFYYSAATSTNINEVDKSVFSVYPNPATESVSFSWNGNYENLELVLYQVNGTRVLEQNTSSGKSVSIADLENGVYLFKLMNGQQTVKTGKLIKN